MSLVLFHIISIKNNPTFFTYFFSIMKQYAYSRCMVIIAAGLLCSSASFNIFLYNQYIKLSLDFQQQQNTFSTTPCVVTGGVDNQNNLNVVEEKVHVNEHQEYAPASSEKYIMDNAVKLTWLCF